MSVLTLAFRSCFTSSRFTNFFASLLGGAIRGYFELGAGSSKNFPASFLYEALEEATLCWLLGTESFLLAALQCEDTPKNLRSFFE